MNNKSAECPNTHCERASECRSPHECISAGKSWGDVFWLYISAGCDRSDAAYRADLHQERVAGKKTKAGHVLGYL